MRTRRGPCSAGSTAVIGVVALLVAAPHAARAESIAFDTAYVRLVLDGTGCARSLTTLADSTELLRRDDVPFVVVHARGAAMPATQLARDGEDLVLHFTDPSYVVSLRVTAEPSHLVIAVHDVRGESIESLEFARLAVAIDQNVGSTLAIRWDAGFSVVMVPGQEKVETVASRDGIMMSVVHRDPGMEHPVAAVLAVPTAEFATGMERVEGSLGIPSPRLGGAWAKASQDARRSYLFVDLTESNVKDVLHWAQLGDFGGILIYAHTWAESPGTYAVNMRAFPGGEAGLASVIATLHAAGLRVGMHCLTSLVAKGDPLASPLPDARLLKDATATLASRLSASSMEIVLTGDARGFPREVGQPGGTDVRIGDEIVRYHRVVRGDAGEATLVGCERGANGTRPSAHASGTRIDHLVERQGAYLADLRTSLSSEIADRVAGLIDRVGFDMIYLDAGEVNDSNGPFWYWAGRQQEEILRRVRRPLLVQGSGTTAWTWHRFTRGTCDDGVAVGRDAWLEVHKIGQVLPSYRRNRMPAELGWWPLYERSPGRSPTTRAEAERLGMHSLDLDVPFSVETTVAMLAHNPDSARILDTLGGFERARLDHCSRTDHAPGVACEKSDMPERSTVPLFTETAREALRLSVPLQSEVVTGVLAARIPVDASKSPSSLHEWLALLRGGPAELDLSHYAGVAVTLDVAGPALEPGKQAPVLDVQLEMAGARYRDHLVDLDFRGERTIVVEGPSAERVIREFSPAPGTYSLKSSLADADFARTVALNVRWMRGGEDRGTTIAIRHVDVLLDVGKGAVGEARSGGAAAHAGG